MTRIVFATLSTLTVLSLAALMPAQVSSHESSFQTVAIDAPGR